ncbi:MAG: hypothetical protein J7M29_10740, partial [Verrucomicrobia bacterium]|nr:hypothetical protein [Verrucomicrobiota bacterium]
MLAPVAKAVRIKDLPESERPRERLLERGPEALSNAELIAILLRTGSRGRSLSGRSLIRTAFATGASMA